jgi:hypothetical protein
MRLISNIGVVGRENYAKFKKQKYQILNSKTSRFIWPIIKNVQEKHNFL